MFFSRLARDIAITVKSIMIVRIGVVNAAMCNVTSKTKQVTSFDQNLTPFVKLLRSDVQKCVVFVRYCNDTIYAVIGSIIPV